jgi:chromosome segregation ATPase
MADEKTVESVELELAATKSALETTQAALTEASEENKALSEENKELQEDNDEKSKTIASLEQQVEELREANENLKEEAKRAPASNPQFTVGDDTYEVLAKSVNIPGIGKRTALEVAADEDAQKALVKVNSGLIRKIIKEQA